MYTIGQAEEITGVKQHVPKKILAGAGSTAKRTSKPSCA